MAEIKANVEVDDNASGKLDHVTASSEKTENAFSRLIGKVKDLGGQDGPEKFAGKTDAAFKAAGHSVDDMTAKVKLLKTEINDLHSKEVDIHVTGLDKALAEAIELRAVLNDLNGRSVSSGVGGSSVTSTGDSAVVREIRGLRADLAGYANGGGAGAGGGGFSTDGGYGGGEGGGFLGGLAGAFKPGLLALGIGAAPGIVSAAAGLGAGLFGGAGSAGLAYSAALPAMATMQVLKGVGSLTSKPVIGAISGASSMLTQLQQSRLTNPQAIAQTQLQQSQAQALTAASNQQQLAALTAAGEGPGTQAYASAVAQMETTAAMTQIQNQQAISQQRQSAQLANTQARQLETETLRQQYGITDPNQVLGVARQYQGLTQTFGQTFAGGERGNQTFGAASGALQFAQGSGIKLLAQQWDQFFPVVDQGLTRLEKFGSSSAGQTEIAYWTKNLPSIAAGAINVAGAVAKLGGNLTADLAPLTEHFETGLAGFFGRSADWAGSTQGINTINQVITASEPVWAGFARVTGAAGKGIESLMVNGGSQLAARGLNDLANDIPGIVKYMEQGVATVEGLGPEVKELEGILGSAFGSGGGFGVALTVTKDLLDVLQSITGVLGPAGTHAALASAFAYRAVSQLTGGGGALSRVLGVGGAGAARALGGAGAEAESAIAAGGIRARLGSVLSTVAPALPLALTGTILAQSGGLTGTLGDSLLGYAGASTVGKLLASRGVQINGLRGVSTTASRATGELTDAGYSAADIAEGGGAEALLEGLGGAADVTGIGLPVGLALGAAGAALPFIASLFGGGRKSEPKVAAAPAQQYGSLTSFSDLSQYLNQVYTGNTGGSSRQWVADPNSWAGGSYQTTANTGIVGYGTPGAGYGNAKQRQEQQELRQDYLALQQTTAQQAGSMGSLVESYAKIGRTMQGVRLAYSQSKKSAADLKQEHEGIKTLLDQQKSTLQQMSQIDPYSVNYSKFGAATSKNGGAINTLLSIGRGSAGVGGLASTQLTLSRQASSLRSARLAVLAATPVGNRPDMEEALASGNPDQLAAVMGQTPRNSALHSALQNFSRVAQGGTLSEVEQELSSVGVSVAALTAAQRKTFGLDYRRDRSAGRTTAITESDVAKTLNQSILGNIFGGISGGGATTSTAGNPAHVGARAGHSLTSSMAAAAHDQTSTTKVKGAAASLSGLTSSSLTSEKNLGAMREVGHRFSAAIAGGMGSQPSTRDLNSSTTAFVGLLTSSLGATSNDGAVRELGHQYAQDVAGGLISQPSIKDVTSAVNTFVGDITTQLGAPQLLSGVGAAGGTLAQTFADGLEQAAMGSAGATADNAMYSLGYSIARSVSRGAAAGASHGGGGGGGTGGATITGLRNAGGATRAISARANASMALIDANANAIARAKLPYELGGGHNASGSPSAHTENTQSNGVGGSGDVGYDCSGVLSALLMRAGLMKSVQVSGWFMTAFSAGPGSGADAITIYASNGHVFCYMDGRYYGAGWLPGSNVSGARWDPSNQPFQASIPGYKTRHVVIRHRDAKQAGDLAVDGAKKVAKSKSAGGGRGGTTMGADIRMGDAGSMGSGGAGAMTRGGRRVASSSEGGKRPVHVEIYIGQMHANDDGEYHRTLGKLTTDFKQAMLTATQTDDDDF
jgi:hypothetical protein